MTEAEIIKLIAVQGPWAILFVGLLFYVMRENSKREASAQAFLREMLPLMRQLHDSMEDCNKNIEIVTEKVAHCPERLDKLKDRV